MTHHFYHLLHLSIMTTRIAAFIWTVFILVASLMPKVAVNNGGFLDIPYLDKVGHMIMYAFFVYLWSRTLSVKTSRVKAARAAFYISIILGLTMEVMQWALNSGRHFEILDIIANIIGSIIGLTAFYKIIKH